MEDTSKQPRPEHTITTQKHLKRGVWKYFGFYNVDGKVTKKDMADCRLCKNQLAYTLPTTNLLTHLLTFQQVRLRRRFHRRCNSNELLVMSNSFILDFWKKSMS